MKTRMLVIGVALLLAIGATLAVFMYVDGVRSDAQKNPLADTVNVIVPKEDIPAGTNLDLLVSEGLFTTVTIPTDAVVQGAVTDLTQIQGRTTSATILEGEQITTARLQGASERTGGVLGIREGYQAVSISLDASQAGGGFIRTGDHITVYATLKNVSIIRGNLAQFLAGKAPADGKKQNIGDFTVTVVPDVRVLRVVGQTGSSTRGAQSIQLSLELRPADAQRVIFARENGSVWIALLPPGGEGVAGPPVNVGELLVFRAGPV
jgi:pilus assembly protein CpaB